MNTLAPSTPQGSLFSPFLPSMRSFLCIDTCRRPRYNANGPFPPHQHQPSLRQLSPGSTASTQSQPPPNPSPNHHLATHSPTTTTATLRASAWKRSSGSFARTAACWGLAAPVQVQVLPPSTPKRETGLRVRWTRCQTSLNRGLVFRRSN